MPPTYPNMTDKDRRDRSGHNPSGSHPGTGALSFLPSIFGRRPAPAPAVTSRISTSVTEGNTRKSIDHDAMDSLPTTGKDKGVNLGVPEIPPPRRAPSPTPFDLEGALQVMDPKNKESTEVMSQMVKATAVYLANLLITSEDVFVETSRHDAALTEDQLKTLYLRAYNLASPSSDSTLRIAAIRLLAALFATSPPPKDHSKTDQRMELITTRSLYKIITTPSSDNSTTLEQTNVIVGALKALTKNGAEVEGMSGLVGWLVKALSQITDEWIKYCSVKDDHSNDWTERSKVSIVNLHGTLLTFSPSHLRRSNRPMLQKSLPPLLSSFTPSSDPKLLYSDQPTSPESSSRCLTCFGLVLQTLQSRRSKQHSPSFPGVPADEALQHPQESIHLL
jgi:hypothetical protein